MGDFPALRFWLNSNIRIKNLIAAMIAGVGLSKDMTIFQNKEQMRTFFLQIKTKKSSFILIFYPVSRIINHFIVYQIPYGLRQFLLWHLKGSKFSRGTNIFHYFWKVLRLCTFQTYLGQLEGVSGCISDYFWMDKDYIWVFKDYKDHIFSLSSLYQTIKTKDHRQHHWRSRAKPNDWFILIL